MTTATITEERELHQQLDAQLRRLFSNTPTELEVQGDSFTDMFTIVEPLGVGGEGEVYRVRDGDGNLFIAKKVSCFTNTKEHRDIETQIEALQRLNHPNIPSYVDCLVEEEEKYHKRNYFLITENVEGETLTDRWERIKTVPKQQLEDICEQTLLALEHAHSNGVLHRDIKPDNLLLTSEGKVKVIDWGVAKVIGAETRFSTLGVVGTVGYMAPEVIDGEKATEKSDIYSLGATLIAAARKKHPKPFDGSAEMKQYLSELKLGNFSKRLESMVEEDPNDREWDKNVSVQDDSGEFRSWRFHAAVGAYIGLGVGAPLGLFISDMGPYSSTNICALAGLVAMSTVTVLGAYIGGKIHQYRWRKSRSGSQSAIEDKASSGRKYDYRLSKTDLTFDGEGFFSEEYGGKNGPLYIPNHITKESVQNGELTGTKIVLLQIRNSGVSSYFLNSQLFRGERPSKLEFKFAGGETLIFEDGQFSLPCSEVYEIHDAFR